MRKLWRIYFTAPASYSSRYTTVSRNFLNVGILASIFSVWYIPALLLWGFAFKELPQDLSESFTRYEGIYQFVSHYKSVQYCVSNAVTYSPIICAGPLAPVHASPEMRGKKAVGYGNQQVGLIALEVSGIQALTAEESKEKCQYDILKFFVSMTIALAAIGTSVSRQVLLVKNRKLDGSATGYGAD